MPDKTPIVLRNTMRRPLTFHVAGQTVRLAPGERVEMPGEWLGNADLHRFCNARLLVNESAVQEEMVSVIERAEERVEGPVEEREEERRPDEVEARSREREEEDEGEASEESSLLQRLRGKKSGSKTSKTSKTGKHKPTKPEN